ncbi:nitrous oxide reductase family maturation protein NosD [Cohnella sp. GCM10027633]|uniref:right-handed parallel beta-helix repeat-containing protein n=1 Tax=unclassified Cohnella TaxID=2636738 RepID=UPI00363DCAE8
MPDAIIQYYVAPGGNDDAPGSLEAPFGTIARARDAVRERIARGMTSDVTVYLRGGTYELSNTLAFDDRDSGKNGFRVAYRNAPGERPIIVGGVVLTGWEKQGDAVWTTKVPAGATFDTLYADDRRIHKARLPAMGYYETGEADEGKEREGVRFLEGDIPPDARLDGAQAFVWPGRGEWNWFSETKPVRELDRDSRMLLFESPASWGIDRGSRYYLQGSIDFLRAPGQFHLDRSAGVVYYWPEDGADPNGQAVCAPRLTRLVELKGRDDVNPLTDFELSGLTLACTDGFREYRMQEANAEQEVHREALIYVDAAEHIRISGCAVRQSGTSGIFLDRRARDITIERNRIANVGYVGIYAAGYAPGEGLFLSAEASYTNRGHRIAHNRITNGGQLIGHGCGILLYQSGDNVIERNEISRMPRYGISLKGLRYGTMPKALYGVPVTWDNHYDFLHTRDNRIVGNDISNVMEDSQDGGMIEAWGPGKGNVIHGNRLHHSGIHFSFGFGIYLDDASDGFTVTGNQLDHLYSTGKGKLWMAIFSKGIGNRIAGNLLVDNPMAISAIGTQEMVGDANKLVVAEGNIVCNSGAYLYYFANWEPERMASSDRNLIWRSGEPTLIAGEIPPIVPVREDQLELGEYVLQLGEYDWATWRSLLGGRFDAASLNADPLFRDAANGDYRLRPESPAYALGWNDIDDRVIGPEDDEVRED